MKTLVTWLMVVSTALGALATTGCRKRPERTTSADKADDDAQKLLTNVIGILTRQGDSDAYDAAVAQLNKFLNRRPEELSPLADDAKARVAQALGSASVEPVARKEFDPSDIEYLRNAFFVRQVARQLSASASGGPKEFARRAFAWTSAQVSLVSPPTSPRPPSDILGHGFGEARDRMWIFIDLIRQADLLGAVVAVTTKDRPDELVPWLVGLVEGEEVYLFDPVAGLPVYDGEGNLATLAQVTADPTLATQPYGERSGAVMDPAKVDRWALLLALEEPMFAPRMAFVESKLAGDDRASLVIDLEKAIARADAAMKKASSQSLGVQVWQYPKETTRAFLVEKRKWPAVFYRWITRQNAEREKSLTVADESALRGLVERDLNPTDTIVYDLSLKRLEGLALADRRRTILRLTHSTVYFTGLAQRQRSPEDPSAACEWFDRYWTRAQDWKYRRSDVINIVTLAKAVVGPKDGSRDPQWETLWSRLSEASREKLMRASAVDKEPKIDEAVSVESGPTINMPEPLTAVEISQLLAEINDALTKPDVFDKSAFTSTRKEPITGPLARLLEADALALSAEAVGWRNRLIADQLLLEGVMPAERPWLVGGILRHAECLAHQGKRDDALALLRKEHPALVPLQSAALEANAFALEKGLSP